MNDAVFRKLKMITDDPVNNENFKGQFKIFLGATGMTAIYILFQKINVGCSILGQEEWGWVAFTFHQLASEYHVDVWQGLLLMQRLSSTYQANRALFNKSTQI